MNDQTLNDLNTWGIDSRDGEKPDGEKHGSDGDEQDSSKLDASSFFEADEFDESEFDDSELATADFANVDSNDDDIDEPELDEDELAEDVYYDRFRLDSGERRQEKYLRKNLQPRKVQQAETSDLVDEVGLEDTFETSYTPARFEKIWLRDSLQTFYLEGLITDVLMLVKGGKEANVYLCQAHPSTGYELLAAKVYRPQQFRNLRNDSTYREGREILDSEQGGVVERRGDSREMRALKNKTNFGTQMLHQSWLGYEYNTLNNIYNLGASVPKPISMGENAIVMEYVGDAQMAAPILGSVALEPDQVEPIFDEVIRNIELMLVKELIHGDLSGYNILYWKDEITLIDFPQVTSALSNRNAFRIFLRDVTRVCEYFATQGKQLNADRLAHDLWERCIGVPPNRQLWD